jgi:hypothetical protein
MQPGQSECHDDDDQAEFETSSAQALVHRP